MNKADTTINEPAGGVSEFALELKPKYTPSLMRLLGIIFFSWLIHHLSRLPPADLWTEAVLLGGLIALSIYYLIVLVLLTFVRPARARLDIQGRIHWAPLFGSWHNDRAWHGYSTAIWRNRGREPSESIILYRCDGGIVELSGFVMHDIRPLIRALEKLNVRFLGKESSWFPFRKLRFRYRLAPKG